MSFTVYSKTQRCKGREPPRTNRHTYEDARRIILILGYVTTKAVKWKRCEEREED